MNPSDLYRPIGPTPPAGMRQVVGPKELHPSRTMPEMADVAQALYGINFANIELATEPPEGDPFELLPEHVRETARKWVAIAKAIEAEDGTP